MSKESFTITGNVSGSVLGGSHDKVVVHNGDRPDVDELRSELAALRQRIEALAPATPDKDAALADLAGVEAAVHRDGDGDAAAAEASLSSIERWSRRLGLALEVTKLVDQVRTWFA